MLRQEFIIEQLQDMGLARTDTVLIHSSMKNIGPVEGGAEALLATLMDYFKEGLLCFPTLSWETAQADPRVYDVVNTPSIVGLLPEMFRKQPGVIRSWNPTHSMAAFGKDAEAFTANDHKTGTPCGRGSTWHQLIQRDAFILMAGCTLTTCTFIHGIEEWCDIPGRIGPPLEFTLVKPDGSTSTIISSQHASMPSVNYWKIEDGLKQAGLMQILPLGHADTLVMRARDLYAYTTGCLHMNSGLFNPEEQGK